MTGSRARSLGRTSTWFDCHRYLFSADVRVADLACGLGRHAIAAAGCGARVIGVDRSLERLWGAQAHGADAAVSVSWIRADLERIPFADGAFDVVMVFNYLNRDRMPAIERLIRPGGFLLYETFWTQQRSFGWGPESPRHLLEPGEILRLTPSLAVEAAREIVEVIGDRSSARAGGLYKRVQ